MRTKKQCRSFSEGNKAHIWVKFNKTVDMKQISNKEYERYHKYQIYRLYGRILTPDGLRLICAALDYDPEKIGKHMLEMLAKFRSEGIIEQ